MAAITSRLLPPARRCVAKGECGPQGALGGSENVGREVARIDQNLGGQPERPPNVAAHNHWHHRIADASMAWTRLW